MYESIVKTPVGPVWALLVKTALTLNLPVPLREIYDKVDGAGAPSWAIEKVVDAVYKRDATGFMYWLPPHVRRTPEQRDEDEKLFFASYDAQMFSSERSWAWALRLARSLRAVQSDEGVAACLMLAAATHPAAKSAGEEN